MKKMIPFTKQIHFKTMIAEITDIEVTHNLKVKDDSTIEGDILVDGTYKMHEASQIEEEFHYNLPFTIEVDEKYDINEAVIAINDFYFEIINEEDLKVNIELEIENVTEKQPEISLEEEVIRSHIEKTPVDLEPIIEKIPVEVEEAKEKIEVPSVDELEELSEDLEEDITPELLEEETPPNTYKEPIFTNTINNSIELPATNINIIQNNEKESTPPVRPNPTSNYSNIFDTISNDETFVTYYVYIVRESDTLDSILEKYKVDKEDISLYNDLENIKVGTKIIIPCHNE